MVFREHTATVANIENYAPTEASYTTQLVKSQTVKYDFSRRWCNWYHIIAPAIPHPGSVSVGITVKAVGYASAGASTVDFSLETPGDLRSTPFSISNLNDGLTLNHL